MARFLWSNNKVDKFEKMMCGMRRRMWEERKNRYKLGAALANSAAAQPVEKGLLLALVYSHTYFFAAF